MHPLVQDKKNILIFGTISYLIFLLTFLYAIGFITNWLVPTSIDSGTPGSSLSAIIINLLLLSLFAVQHSVMARPKFKAWWHQYVPESAERSVYVLASSLALLLLFWCWQPLPGMIWHIENSFFSRLMWGIHAAGWGLVLVATFLINHFDLFGLRQIYLNYKDQPYTPLEFKTPWLYQYLRHPLYAGWFICFWVTPSMSQGHLLFAAVASAYILVAIQLEEKDLVHFLGDAYVKYKQNVPMLIPFCKK